jgi:transposase
LSGKVVPFARAAELNLSYSTVTRWLARFRENGMRGLFPAAQISRQPERAGKGYCFTGLL